MSDVTPPPALYMPDTSKPQAIIVDLDGTLAHNVTGRKFTGKGQERVYEDEVDALVLSYIRAMYYGELGGYDGKMHDLIFMSGRNERARAETVRWLHDKAGFMPDEYSLFMRADDDGRHDYIIKGELFDAHVRHNYNVLLALDDRSQVVNLWRSMGITCWQVAEGNF